MPAFEYDFPTLEATEDELRRYGITPGEDFETVDWRAGLVANRAEDAKDRLSDSGGAIVHELVKSYGFRRDPATHSWSWSFENIGQSFKEDPVWTTLDYLLLAVPIAKVGTAATKVAKGTGAAAKTMRRAQEFRDAPRALRGGMTEGNIAQELISTTKPGRKARAGAQVARVFGKNEPGFAEALDLEMRHGVARNSVSRWFASTVARRGTLETFDPNTLKFTTHVDPEWDSLIKASGGGDPFERRAMYDVMRREGIQEQAALERMGEDLIRMENKVLRTEDERIAFGKAKSRGQAPEEIVTALGKDAGYLAEKMQDFKLRVHVKAHDLGLLSDEAFEWGIEKYWPRIWREAEALRLAKAGVKESRRGLATGGGQAAGRRFRYGRSVSEEEFEAVLSSSEAKMKLVLDPAAQMKEIIEYGSYVSGQGFLQKLGRSSLVVHPQQLVNDIVDLARGVPADEADAALRSRYHRNYGKEIIEKVLQTVDNAAAEGRALTNIELDEIAGSKLLGWKKMEDAFRSANIRGYLSNIPESMKSMYMDPTLSKDLEGMANFVDAMPASMRLIYMGAMAHFKATKTAYNPATHMRNWAGAVIFHHLTVGGAGPMKTGFREGWKALQAGAKLEKDPGVLRNWQEFMESGLASSSFDREIVDTIRAAMKSESIDPTRVTALDWLKLVPKLRDTKATDKVLDAASWAERKYRLVDELAKADAFIVRRDHWLKALNKDEVWRAKDAKTIRMEARARATQDVVKFQPVFHQNSPFTDLVRNVIPFSSFTTEALRVWKNAMVEKPHLAFFYNHVAESMSEMLGAVSGFNSEDLQKAKESLPEYAQNKKMLVLPFRVDGKPTFLDLSYMIPMGNMNESGDVEANFFDRVHMDPFSANPFLSLAYAVKTGKDAFSGQPIEPRFAERQLGIESVPTKGMGRKALGLAEHILKMALPPLIPPGYAGINLYELARGEKHPISGADLEEGVFRTVAANVLGLRTYEADVSAQLINVRRETQRQQEEIGVQWSRWQYGHANGKAAMMENALQEIRQLRLRTGDSEEGTAKYLEQGIKRREAGKWRGVSTKHMEEVFRRSTGVTTKSLEDLKMMSELVARYQERAFRSKAGKEWAKKRGAAGK